MKERFRQYHIVDDLERIYSDALIVLDTNSLLNLYRYSEDTRAKYFEILRKVEARLFLTHHVCNEFYRNRLTIIENRSTFKETINELIEEHFNKLLNVIKNASGIEKYNSALSILKHESGLKEEILREIELSLTKIGETIESFEQDLDLKYVQDRDPILAEVVDIFEKKIGKEFSQKELEEIYKDGENRYKIEVPPGYKDDKNKGVPEKYGDLVIWNEMQVLAKEQKRDVLFVSDDRKEDWAIKFKGHDLGPRKELIKEFLDNTEQLFYSITTNGFIKLISENYSVGNTESLEEETEIIHKNIEERERNKLEWIKPDYIREYLNRTTLPKTSADHIQEYLDRRSLPKTSADYIQEHLDRRSLPKTSADYIQEYLDRSSIPKTAVEYLNESLEQRRKAEFTLDEIQKYLKRVDEENQDGGDNEEEDGSHEVSPN